MGVFSMQALLVWNQGEGYYRFFWILVRDGWKDPAEQIGCPFIFSDSGIMTFFKALWNF